MRSRRAKWGQAAGGKAKLGLGHRRGPADDQGPVDRPAVRDRLQRQPVEQREDPPGRAVRVRADQRPARRRRPGSSRRAAAARRRSAAASRLHAPAVGPPRPRRPATAGTPSPARRGRSVREEDPQPLRPGRRRRPSRRGGSPPGPAPRRARTPPRAARPSRRSSGGSARWRCPSRRRRRARWCAAIPLRSMTAQRGVDDRLAPLRRAHPGHRPSLECCCATVQQRRRVTLTRSTLRQMVRTTPFHARLSELNTTGLYGALVGLPVRRCATTARPSTSTSRSATAAGFFDTSPLYKYWIRGRDAERFLAGVMARDIRTCRPAGRSTRSGATTRATCWRTACCSGTSDNEFLLTAPSRTSATCATWSAGSRSRSRTSPRLRRARRPGPPLARDPRDGGTARCATCRSSALAEAKIGVGRGDDLPHRLHRRPRLRDRGRPRRRPRRSSTPSIEAGAGHGLRPFGEEALLMARIEAGLLLIDVEFSSSRFAYTDHERVTPSRARPGLDAAAASTTATGRSSAGPRSAASSPDGTSRWATVGLLVDWQRLRPALHRRPA